MQALRFVPPVWLTERRLVVVAAALGGALEAIPAMTVARLDGDFGSTPVHSVAPITSALLSALLVWFASSRRSPVACVVVCIFGGWILGAVNAGLVFGIVTGGAEALPAFFLASVFGLVIAAPLGFAFGVAFTPLAFLACMARQNKSHEALDGIGVVAGFFVAFSALLRAVVSPDAAVVICMLVGIATAGTFMCRMFLRRRWIDAARRGEVANLSFVTAAPDEIDQALPHLLVHRAFETDLLVYDDARVPTYRNARQVLQLARL